MFRFLYVASRRNALVVVSLLVMAMAAGGIFWYSYATANPAPNVAGTSSGNPADASSNDAQSGTQILLGLARDAMHDGRLVAPAGSNAYEFYLSVLQLEPQNRTAQEALRESFPRASEEIESTIGFAPDVPDAMTAANKMPEDYDRMPADYAVFKQYLLDRYK